MWSILSQAFSMKYMSLLMLVLQNTFLVVFMHYSRIVSTGDDLYASSTAVVSMEVIKMVCCIFMVGYLSGGMGGLLTALHSEIVLKPQEMLYLAVPSVLYSVQNNLLYYALSHLDAVTFQVGYQLKLLTTACFSVYMLNKYLSRTEWIALILLTVGVSLAQLSASQTSGNSQNSLLGFVAVLLAAVTSGFSGVYFERILKNSTTSLWMRNIQLGVTSILSAFVGVVLSGDLPSVRTRGFFHGYTSVVVAVILLQAIGGLIVAIVVKYADNILKGFAASFSILTSCILSYFLLNDFHPSLQFVVGFVLVNVSMYLYSLPNKTKVDSDARRNDGADRSVEVQERLLNNSSSDRV